MLLSLTMRVRCNLEKVNFEDFESFEFYFE